MRVAGQARVGQSGKSPLDGQRVESTQNKRVENVYYVCLLARQMGGYLYVRLRYNRTSTLCAVS